MNKIIICGLEITTSLAHISFEKSRSAGIETDVDSSLLKIYFNSRTTNEDIEKMEKFYQLSIKRFGDVKKISEFGINTDKIYNIYNAKISINGMNCICKSLSPYSFSQILLTDDIDDIQVKYNDNMCILFIPKRISSVINNPSVNIKSKEYKNAIKEYLVAFDSIPYLERNSDSEVPKFISNYHKVNFNNYNRDIILQDTKSFSYSPKEKYVKYRISMDDVHAEFIKGVKKILDGFGMSLIKAPVQDEHSLTTNYITYTIIQVGKQGTRKTLDGEILREAIKHSSQIEFVANGSDLIVLEDFKNKYQNIDLLSNFTEFIVSPKDEEDDVKWRCAVFWNPIDTSFTPGFGQDSFGKSGFSYPFSCMLDYYIVYDNKYNEIIDTIIKYVNVGYEFTDSDSENQINYNREPEDIETNDFVYEQQGEFTGVDKEKEAKIINYPKVNENAIGMCKISFYNTTNDNCPYSEINVPRGSIINLPPEPSYFDKTGRKYYFKGWASNKKGGQIFTTALPVAMEDTKYYARYSIYK